MLNTGRKEEFSESKEKIWTYPCIQIINAEKGDDDLDDVDDHDDVDDVDDVDYVVNQAREEVRDHVVHLPCKVF